MTLLEKAQSYGMETDELMNILSDDPKNRRFFEHRNMTEKLDPVTERALVEIMSKQPTVSSIATKNDTVSKVTNSETMNQNTESIDDLDANTAFPVQNKNEKQDPMESEADVVKPDVNSGNHSMQNDNESETHKKTKRVRRKTTLLAEIPSESNSVPSTILRKFYANNFTIKPEKIFFMDDDAVKEKIDEKYIVLVRENDYLFLKKNTSIISVAKD